MTWFRTRRSTLLLIVALVAAACGGDDGSSPDPTPVDEASAPAPSGNRYEVVLEDDSRLVVTLDVPGSDPRIAPFESYRELTGADPVVWLVGEVTPPEGVETTGRFVTFVAAGKNPIDDDGETADDGISSASFACSALDRWLYAEGAEVADETIEAYNDLFTGPCNGTTMAVPAAAGTTTAYVMLYPAPTLPEFDRLFAGLAFEMSPAS